MDLDFSFIRPRRTPLVMQTEAAECGLACLAMISAHFGRHEGLIELRSRLPVSSRGTSLRSLMGLATALGLIARPVKVALDDLTDLGERPVVLHWNLNHFVVLDGRRNGRLRVLDPNVGERLLTLDEVSECYTGICVEIHPGDAFMPVAAASRRALDVPLLGPLDGVGRVAAVMLLLGVLIQIFTLATPFYFQWVIDDAFRSGDESYVAVLALTFSAAVVFHSLLVTIRAWRMVKLTTLLKFRWFGNIMDRYLAIPFEYFQKRSLGDAASRLASADQAQHVMASSFLESLMDGALAFIVLAAMFHYAPALAALAIAAVLTYFGFRRFMQPRLESATKGQLIHSARQQSFFLETIRGLQTVRLFNREDERRTGWLQLLARQLNQEIDIQRLQLAYQLGNSLLFGVERVVLIWLGAKQVMGGQMSLGMLIAFMGYKELFTTKASRLVDTLADIRLLKVHLDRVREIREQPAAPRTTGASAAISETPLLTLHNVAYRYGAMEPDVVANLSLTVRFGEHVCITGPSGGGKSTLMRILGGLSTPTQGSMTLDGRSATELGLHALRESVGVVMQDDVLFSGSLAENIHFFDDQPDFEWMENCARDAGIHDEIIAMPMGYRSLVGDLGVGLSGGQKQRLFLARALYKRPKILLLDEATSHLDIRNEERVNDAISKLRITRIVVAHRPDTIALAERVVRIDGGQIVADDRRFPHPADVPREALHA